MLQTAKPPGVPSEDRPAIDAGTLTETYQALTGLLRRQYPIFITLMTLTLGLGILYLATTPAIFRGMATMVIDTRRVQQFQQSAGAADDQIDAGTVLTQVEILQSENIDKAVVRDLHLTDDPEFTQGRTGFIRTVIGLFSRFMADAPPLSDSDALQRALNFFDANRLVTRVGQTYAMQITFDSINPEKAARIANAVVDAYVTDQLESKFQSTKRASLWLQDRIGELRSQASTADRAVVDFKSSNNIVNADGRLVNEQQVTEVNTQLITAQAASAEAKARLDRIDQVMTHPIPDASMADALKNEIIVRLRGQYLDLAARESIFAARYGTNHQAVLNLRIQMGELQRNISDEMRKIAESYRSEYAIAQARENALRASLKSSVSETQNTNQAQVELHELEGSAQSYRALYNNFVQRYMDAVQQQSFPITEARIISPAEVPTVRARPNAIAVVGASLIGGLLLSFGLAVTREMADRVFRTGARVEDHLHLDCLATLPLLRDVRKVASSVQTGGTREVVLGPGLWRYAVDQPFSIFTEGLRSIKIAADLAAAGRTNTVLGITSTLPGEGKSTIAANFAALLSHAGSRVLLIDADLRNPSLSRVLAPDATEGLVTLVNGLSHIEDLIWTDPKSKLSFLPAGAAQKLIHTDEMLGSERIRTLIAAMREVYDYIVVDLAPLAPVVDTRATVHFIDSYIYAVAWGQTKVDVVEDVLGDARHVHDNILGVVLNKADLKLLGRYERHRGHRYHRKYYSRYGYTT